jgi:acetolactate synthase-1/2/3 large subunit
MTPGFDPAPPLAQRTGGQLLVDQLEALGTSVLFGVPGESYLPVLDALRDERRSIRFVIARHEGAAAFMADASGKLTGRPGVCLVSRGPGALHAANGVHMAMQDSTPMVLLVGQVPTTVRDREAFQEIDIRGTFGSIAKWTVEVQDADRIPEFISRAFATATAGRPGPVVVGLPEDMLRCSTSAAVIAPFERGETVPAAATLASIRALLANAERPLILAGGAGWTTRASKSLECFADDNHVAVATIFRYQDALDNSMATYAGDLGMGANPALVSRLFEADLVLAIGPRLGDVTTGNYQRICAPTPAQKLVHVHQGTEEIGSVYRPTLGLSAPIPAFVEALASMEHMTSPVWTDWADKAHQDYLDWRTPEPALIDDSYVNLAAVMAQLRQLLSDDAIVTNGAGNYSTWLHRYFSFSQFRTQLAPTGGSMGYGLPAALAAKSLEGDRDVVAFAGDGCFLMTGQELATAVQEHLNVIVIVVNNEMYGTIRLHQERRYPGRPFATDLLTPDFAALARSFGAYAETIERTLDFASAFERARSAGTPALLELRVDPRQLTPTVRLSDDAPLGLG